MTGIECINEIEREYGTNMKLDIITNIMVFMNITDFIEFGEYLSSHQYRSVPYFIADTFHWYGTPQGYKYWEDVHNGNTPTVVETKQQWYMTKHKF